MSDTLKTDDLDDFFKIEKGDIDSILGTKMSQEDFVEKTKSLLSRIASNYCTSWESRPLKEDEYPDESVCNKCTGCGTFLDEGWEKDCHQDREQGECYHRFCDYEQVGIAIEDNLEAIYELLSVYKITDNENKIED